MERLSIRRSGFWLTAAIWIAAACASSLSGCASDVSSPSSEEPLQDAGQTPEQDSGQSPLSDAASPWGPEASPQCQGYAHCAATDERCVPIAMYAEPNASEAPWVSVLSQATRSIRVMVYLMGYGGIFDTLKAKAQAGVDVRVILDQSKKSVNQKYFTALQAAGAQVKWSDPKFSNMHAKALVVDDSTAVISTGNYDKSYIQAERNYVIQDRDPDDVASLVSVFDADWQQMTPDLSCTRLVVSPVNARERLTQLIASAQSSLLVESLTLADTNVRAAIVGRKQAGVEVRVILADPSWVDGNPEAASFLATQGIEARYLSSPRVHVKAVVVDGARVYAGSENFSWTSLNKNREVGVIDTTAESVQLMQSTFETDWAAARGF